MSEGGQYPGLAHVGRVGVLGSLALLQQLLCRNFVKSLEEERAGGKKPERGVNYGQKTGRWRRGGRNGERKERVERKGGRMYRGRNQFFRSFTDITD